MHVAGQAICCSATAAAAFGSSEFTFLTHTPSLSHGPIKFSRPRSIISGNFALPGTGQRFHVQPATAKRNHTSLKYVDELLYVGDLLKCVYSCYEPRGCIDCVIDYFCCDMTDTVHRWIKNYQMYGILNSLNDYWSKSVISYYNRLHNIVLLYKSLEGTGFFRDVVIGEWESQSCFTNEG